MDGINRLDNDNTPTHLSPITITQTQLRVTEELGRSLTTPKREHRKPNANLTENYGHNLCLCELKVVRNRWILLYYSSSSTFKAPLKFWLACKFTVLANKLEPFYGLENLENGEELEKKQIEKGKPKPLRFVYVCLIAVSRNVGQT